MVIQKTYKLFCTHANVNKPKTAQEAELILVTEDIFVANKREKKII